LNYNFTIVRNISALTLMPGELVILKVNDLSCSIFWLSIFLKSLLVKVTTFPFLRKATRQFPPSFVNAKEVHLLAGYLTTVAAAQYK